MTSATDLSLYLHVPFCGTRCTYCAFNTYTNVESLIPAYVAALCRELAWLGTGASQPLHTIYFGGGTPSLLSPDQITAILATCRRAFHVTPGVEITIEVNPGSIDSDYLFQLYNTGVNRVSIGMQSAHAQELRMFARQHGVDDVAQTVHAARMAGFTNVSLDLIYGVPHQTLAMWRTSVEAALALQPDHLSMYALGLEAGTPMARWVDRGWLPAPDDDLAADMYELADDLTYTAGLIQYEISNWAKPGAACRHNLQYWRNLPYLGVGAGAHGYVNSIRYEVVRPIQRYIDLAMQPIYPQTFPLTPTVEHSEPINTIAAMSEHMMTGLRLIGEGVSLSGFETRFGIPIYTIYGTAIEQLTGYGLLTQSGDSLQLTPRARLLSNQVFLQFIQT
ncbi:MAG: radical SAM family heme chaperone HemW [Anaerolineae bacterium]|nr:radical SAM family heme chaperone HemW [Anaerolineae bacterium]